MIPNIEPNRLRIPRADRIRRADEALQRLVIVAVVCVTLFLLSLIGLLTVYVQTRADRLDCPTVQPLTKDAQQWPRKLT